MSEIKRYTIEDCFHLRARIGWQGLRSEEFTDYGPYLVTGTDFVNGKIDWDTCYHVDEHRYRQDVGIQLREHDLLITKDGTIGKTAVVQDCPEKVTLNSGVFVVRAINRNVVPEFLYYVLNSHQFDLFMRNILTGSTIKHLNQEHFYKFAFKAPNATRQSKIAEILSTVDEAIDKTRALIEKYKNIKAGMTQDLLANGIDENGMIRSSKTHEYKDSPIGSIPVEWDCSLICNVSEKIWIGLVTTMTKHYVSEGTILIRNNNIRNGWIDVQDIIFLDIKFANLYASRALKTNDLVTVHTGDIGTTAIVTPELNGAHGFATINTRINKNKMIPEFLLYYYNSYIYKNRINVMATGDGRSNFNLYDYVKCYIPIPKIKEQQRIAEMLTAADERIQTERDYLTKLQNIKLGLMQDLLMNTVSVDALL